MNRNDTAAERIGRMLDDALCIPEEDGAEEAACVQAVVGAVAGCAELSPVRVKRRTGMWAAAAAVLLAVGLGTWIMYYIRTDAPIGYRVGDGRTSSSSTGWVRNTHPTDLPIRFDNGSLFLLGERGEAKVVESDRRRVRIDLRDGTVSAKVKGNGHTEWLVEAGPYRVKVLGTQFKVTWRENKTFSVSVTKGRVSVYGDGVGEGVVLASGQSLASSDQGIRIFKTAERSAPAVSLEEHASSTVNATYEPELDAAGLTRPVHPDVVEPAPQSETAPSILHPAKSVVTDAPNPAMQPSSDSPQDTALSWQDEMRAKKWQDAVRLMNEEDFRHSAETADLDTLWHLADAARRLRRFDAARDLFVAVRTRFPGTERASVSAFLLGKTILDRGGEPKGAVRWLRTYLDETQGGALTEEALGRLMEAYRSLGRDKDASACARDYLHRFPKGAYKDEAVRLTGE